MVGTERNFCPHSGMPPAAGSSVVGQGIDKLEIPTEEAYALYAVNFHQLSGEFVAG